MKPAHLRGVKKNISEGGKALREIMQDELSKIADGMISIVLDRTKKLSHQQRLNAIKELPTPGFQEYRNLLLTALSVIATDAIDQARKEVPKAKSVRFSESIESLTLAEFDGLPSDLQRKIKTRADLLVETQLGDLTKAITFQFTSSIDSTDSLDLVEADLLEASEKFITGPSIVSGSGTTASQVVNESRDAFFFDPDVIDEIEAWEFVNGDPQSPICEDLAGRTFSKDDPDLGRYRPPLHHNCESIIAPVLKGELGSTKLESIRPSSQSLEKYITL